MRTGFDVFRSGCVCLFEMENNWTALARDLLLFAPASILAVASAALVYSGWTDRSQRAKDWLRASEIAFILLGLVWVFRWPFEWPMATANLALEWRLVAWAQGVIVYHVAVSYWLHELKGAPINLREGLRLLTSEASAGVAFVAAYGLSWYFIQFYS